MHKYQWEQIVEEYPNVVQANAVTVDNRYNLVAATLLIIWISDDAGMLSQKYIVIKA